MLALIATSFIYTQDFAGRERCDSIEMVRGDPFYEVHYVNSANNCSQPGRWVVELDGIRVEVDVTIPRNNNYEEIVRLKMLDDLPFTIEPTEAKSIPDDGEPYVFVLLPMMF